MSREVPTPPTTVGGGPTDATTRPLELDHGPPAYEGDLTGGPFGALHYVSEFRRDGSLQVLWIDPQLLDLCGFTKDELDGDGWSACIAPEDSGRVSEIAEMLAANGRWEGRLRIRTKSGEVKVLHFIEELEPQSDGRVLLHGCARDVTREVYLENALREREARLSLLNEHLSIAMWSTDRDLYFTWTSGSALASFGYDETETIGRSMMDFVKNPETSPGIDAARHALEGERVRYEVNWRGHYLLCSIEPYRDEFGNIAGTVGIAIDITDLASGVREARDLSREAVELRHARDRHEEDNPEAITVGDLWINPEEFVVRKGDREIPLTLTEFKLLLEFANRPERVLSPEVLVERVWGHAFMGSRSTVAMAIKRLRAKIEDDPKNPKLIVTVRGLGYKLHAA